jgi:hypothetical protein
MRPTIGIFFHFLCLSKENETKEKTLLRYVVHKISGFYGPMPWPKLFPRLQ